MGNIVFVIYRPARQVLAAGMRTVVTGGGGTGAVDSVNGQTGVVVLTATDVGADAAGTAAAEVGTHVAASDPHPQYLTPAEGNAAYDALGAAASAVSTHVAASDPHPQYNTQAEGDARYERNLTAGANITIDRTNPAAPVISASGGGGAGGAVDSVNGQTGVVVLDTDDIAEGVSNLYFTNGRAAAAAPVQTVDGQTGAVSLSSSYAPLSHVGGGGAAHSNAVAAGAAGFMTGADKTKLDGIAAGAQVNVATDLSIGYNPAYVFVNSSTGADATLNAATGAAAGVMSSTDKTKLDGIASGATANATDAQLRDRSTHTGTQAASTISDLAAAVRGVVMTGVSFATATAGLATDSLLVFLGKLQAQVTSLVTTVAGKQDTLVSGTNIKTINGASLLGAGDIAIAGGGSLPVVQTFVGAKSLALTDINTYNVSQDASAQVVTLPAQATVAWTDDAEIHIERGATGSVTIVGAAGVQINGTVAGTFTLGAQYSVVTLKRKAANLWTLFGNAS